MNSLVGTYRIRELVNNGGLANIYLATDESGASVAIRLLRSESAGSKSAVKMFKNGRDVLRSLPAHPHVVRYIDDGKDKGLHYMVIEYVEGANLKQHMVRETEVLANHLSDILVAMADGLQHLHDHGWLHLDFKPENVMVNCEGSVRILDFDTATRITGRPMKLAKNSGTPSCMPPEQLLGQPIDQRADIFAFGVTAYELLTHRKPFTGEKAADAMRNQLDPKFRIEPPSKFNPQVPRQVDAVVLGCLAFDLEKRLPNMTVVAGKLHSALGVTFLPALA